MSHTRPSNLAIAFRLNKRRNKTGALIIYFRITVERKRVELATRFSITQKNWSQQKQLAIGDTSESKEINQQLAIIRADILKHYNRMVALDKPITAELIKNEYLGIRETEKTLKELLDYYHSRFKDKVNIGQKSANTLKCIHTTNEKLKAFIKYRFKVTDMRLPEIKTSFIPELEHYLVTMDKLSNNSAMK